jgi:hypothetical protein
VDMAFDLAALCHGIGDQPSPRHVSREPVVVPS